MRNSLADRIGVGKSKSSDRLQEFLEPPKKRVKISNIPLDVSDYTIEDIIKEFGEPTYFNIYDTKDDRVAMCEFEELKIMESLVEKFNSTDLNGIEVEAEIIDFQKRPDRRHPKGGKQGRRGPRGKRGSHYDSLKK